MVNLLARTLDIYQFMIISGIPKFYAKLMAPRLSLRMAELVEINQSTPTHGRSIHDQSVARKLHKNKVKGVLFILDISCAFDPIAWLLLFKVLRAKGFQNV